MENKTIINMPSAVREKNPLVHCITNYVTVNDVANMLLACGASPVMADAAEEAADITAISSSTLINIGTLNKRTVESMKAAGIKANEMHHPVVLDPVGAGASEYRTNTVFELMKKIHFDVIRGNMSEIRTIADGTGTTKGVDASASDAVTEDTVIQNADFIRKLALTLETVIAVSGKIDIISDGKTVYLCRNGHEMMTKITGSGCMLGAVTAAYCGAEKDTILDSAAAAVSVTGLCGECAYKKTIASESGISSFRTNFIDAMSLITSELFLKGCRLEKI